MKRLLFVLLLASVALAGNFPADIVTNRNQMFSFGPFDPWYEWVLKVDDLMGGSIGTGSVFYVDSNVAVEGDGRSWANAKATLDAAIALCTDYNGDIIYVAQGHAEDWDSTDSVDVDVIGVTIIGCGTGTDRPTFTFDDTDGEFVIGAANTYVYNLAFLPSVAQVVHAIEIEADADGSVIDGCWFMDGETAATDEFMDAVQWTAAANNITVKNCVFESYSSVATNQANSACDLTAGVVEDTKIINNYFLGDYDDAPIFSDDIDLRTLIQGNFICNTQSGDLAIEFTANATGSIIGNRVSTNSPTTAIDAGYMECADNVYLDYGAHVDSDFGPRWLVTACSDTTDQVDMTPEIPDNSILANIMDDGGDTSAYDRRYHSLLALGTDTDAIIADFTDYQLDHVAGVTTTVNADADLTTYVADKSIFSHIMTTGADTSEFRASTDSLQAIRDYVAGTTLGDAIQLDHLQQTTTGVGVGGDLATHVADGSVLAHIMTSDLDTAGYTAATDSLEAIADAIAALSGVQFMGACDSNAAGATYVLSSELAGFGHDFFNSGWLMTCTFDNSAAGSAPEGETRDIVNYNSVTGCFVVSPAFSAQLTTSDKVMLRRYEEVDLTQKATLHGGSGNVFYVDAGQAGTPSTAEIGRTWDGSFTTIATAIAAATADNGDVIYVAAGHTETFADAQLTLNVAGVDIIGLGHGDQQPTIVLNHANASIDVTAADITLKNLKIETSIDNVLVGIDIADTADGLTIDGCTFCNDAATDEILEIIEFKAAGADDVTIKNCRFLMVGASCTEAVISEVGACDNIQIVNNVFIGNWLVSAIWSDQINTNCLIADNIIYNATTGQHCIELTAATTGACVRNMLYADTGTATLDPGSLMCFGNLASAGINEAAIPIPLSADSAGVTEDDDGSNLERLEFLQNKVEDILAGIKMAGGSVGDVYYVDDGGSGGAGTTWATAVTTLDAGVNLCSGNVGDIIFVAPAHDEDLGAAQVTVDVAGITIIGIGEGAEQPQIVFNDATSSIDVTAAGCKIKNLNLHSSTAATTIGIDVDADSFTLEDCLFTDTGDFEFAICVDLGATAENATIRNCRMESTTGTTGATSAIAVTGGVIDRLIVEDCHIWGDFDNAGIYSDQINTNAVIRRNSITNNESGDHAIELTAAMTGDLVDNMLSASTYGSVLDPGSMRCFGNKQCVGTDTGAEDIPLIAGKSYARAMLTGDLNASDNLFQVVGSPIIVTSFMGKCAVDVGGAATIKIFCDATDTFDYDISTSVDVDAADPGATIAFTAAIGESVLTPQAVGASGSLGVPIQWWVEEGMLESTVDAGGNTGEIEWYMIFTPVESGCEVIPQ